MASSLNTFHLSHVGAYSKFIPYTGPPTSKPRSRYRSSKSVAPTPNEQHVLDNTSTVELNMEPTPGNEDKFTMVKARFQLTNLPDSSEAYGSKFGGRVVNDKDELVIDVELQDEISRNGLVLDQYANLIQHEAADRGLAQTNLTEYSFDNERGNDNSIHEVGTISSCDTTRLQQNGLETMCFMQRDFVEQPCTGTIEEWSIQPTAVNNDSRDINIMATDNDKADCDINGHEESLSSIVQIGKTTNVDSQHQHVETPADHNPNESRLSTSMEDMLRSDPRDEVGSVADLQQQSESIPDTLQILTDSAPFDMSLNGSGKAHVRTSEGLLMNGSGSRTSISGENECSNHLPSQSTQQTNHRAALETRTRPSIPPSEEQVEEQDKLSTRKTSGGSASSDAADNIEIRTAGDEFLMRKRRRSTSAERYSLTSHSTIKQDSRAATTSEKHQKPSLRRRKSLSSHPLIQRPLPGAQHSRHNTKLDHNDHSDYRRKGEDLRSSMQSTSVVQHSDLSVPKQKRNLCGTDNEDEYEVERILEARFHHGKLQYRVNWTEYGNDPVWYDASNFKNSPYRLLDFHTANPTQVGPPKRLRKWTQSWEEDRDAKDHPSDNKPRRSRKRGIVS